MADVLLVDDDKNLRAVMREVLMDEGHTVLEAPDGQSALTMLAQAPSSLVVVLDRRLPDMDGIAVLTESSGPASEQARQHAYILCTAGRMVFPAAMQQLLDQLQVLLLAKPFDIDALTALVAEAAKRLVDEG